MTDTYKVLNSTQLGTGATALYTPGTGKMGIIKSIALANQGANTETVTFYINGTDAAHVWGETLSLAAAGSDGASCEWDGTMALANTDTLYAKATDATAVNCCVTGDEVS